MAKTETYVFIPGAGGSPWIWHLVVAELAARGYDAIAVDLPNDDDAAGLSEYVDATVAAIGDRRDLVLVAHSMGGFTAPLVCERVPVDLMVLVAAMVPAPGERPADWWGNTGFEDARRASIERHGGDESIEAAFLHDLSPELVAESDRHNRDQSGTPFEKPWPLAAWPDVPTRFLSCRDDRFFPPDFLRRVCEERLGFTPDEMGGGHLPMLARPVELTDWLERYVVELHQSSRR
jgi:pimeloyl-ACP methyl ester carboxylesterase